MAEAEGYYQILQEQVQSLSTAMNTSEEAEQLRGTAKDMLEALRQCINLIKESELAETPVISGPNSVEPTPPPEGPPGGDCEEAGSIIAAGGPEGVQSSPAVVRAIEGDGTRGELRYVECGG